MLIFEKSMLLIYFLTLQIEFLNQLNSTSIKSSEFFFIEHHNDMKFFVFIYLIEKFIITNTFKQLVDYNLILVRNSILSLERPIFCYIPL